MKSLGIKNAKPLQKDYRSPQNPTKSLILGPSKIKDFLHAPEIRRISEGHKHSVFTGYNFGTSRIYNFGVQEIDYILNTKIL